MAANLENSAVATGLEKVSFHSNPQKMQYQRMFKLPHNMGDNGEMSLVRSAKETSQVIEKQTCEVFLCPKKCTKNAPNSLAECDLGTSSH